MCLCHGSENALSLNSSIAIETMKFNYLWPSGQNKKVVNNEYRFFIS